MGGPRGDPRRSRQLITAVGRLAEEILAWGPHDLCFDRGLPEPAWFHAPDDDHRDAAGLTLGKLGGGCDLVGDADLGRNELATEDVGGPPQVDNRGDAGAADGDVGDADTP